MTPGCQDFGDLEYVRWLAIGFAISIVKSRFPRMRIEGGATWYDMTRRRPDDEVAECAVALLQHAQIASKPDADPNVLVMRHELRESGS